MSRNKFMSSSNPFVSEKKFSQSSLGNTINSGGAMTIQGAVNKTLILAAILIVTALVSASMIGVGSAYLTPILYGSMFLGLGLALLTNFKPSIAHITAPAFALVEGVLVGVVSGAYASMLGFGLIFNAIMLTALCLVSMLVCYKMGWIQATQKFRSIITTATGAIAMIYIVNLGMNMFGMNIPYLHEANAIGIGISLVIIGVATLNLILDFDNIERGAKSGAPKQMEWVVSMGLLWTLVWLYMEILRLLAMFSSSD